jgi:hypothetical protein
VFAVSATFQVSELLWRKPINPRARPTGRARAQEEKIMDQTSKPKIFKVEGGKIYFSKRTERTFFFILSLIVMTLVGLQRFDIF